MLLALPQLEASWQLHQYPRETVGGLPCYLLCYVLGLYQPFPIQVCPSSSNSGPPLKAPDNHHGNQDDSPANHDVPRDTTK